MDSRAQQHLLGIGAGALVGAVGAGIAGLSGASGFTCLVIALGSALPICAGSLIWTEVTHERKVREAEDRIRQRSKEIEQQFAARNYKEVVGLANLIDQDRAVSDTELSRAVQEMVAKARQILAAREEAAQKERQRQLLADEEKREIEQRIRQERERVRVEEERRRERQRIEEEQRKDREHLATLRAFACSLSGGCWVTRGTGGSDVIRGMTLTVYKASPAVVSAFRSFYPKVRFAADVLPQIELLRAAISSDVVAKAETNIDGKYTLGVLPGDRYVLFASWASTSSAMYWIKQLDVDCNGARTLNLHNENATEILNEETS